MAVANNLNGFECLSSPQSRGFELAQARHFDSSEKEVTKVWQRFAEDIANEGDREQTGFGKALQFEALGNEELAEGGIPHAEINGQGEECVNESETVSEPSDEELETLEEERYKLQEAF